MDKAALIISIVSILATILIAIWQILTTINVNKINLKSNVCEKIFDSYLISLIPEARKFIMFDCKGKFIGGEKLNNVLVSMKKDALYFRYNDKKFYDQLEIKLTELEDFVANAMNKKYETTKQADMYNEIDEGIKSIYQIIEDKKIKG